MVLPYLVWHFCLILSNGDLQKSFSQLSSRIMLLEIEINIKGILKQGQS